MISLSRYIADLHEEKQTIVVYGNFALYKKGLGLQPYQVNQLSKEELVVYIMGNGTWKNLGEIAGYIVSEVVIGSGRLVVATKENDIKFILGI